MSSPSDPIPHVEHDPFSKESLDAVQTVEALPFSAAFEQVMFDARLDRTVTYLYQTKRAHGVEEYDPADIDPLVLEPSIMLSLFPESLRPIFPGLSYVIERLEAQQIESRDGWTLAVQFEANGIRHELQATRSGTLYSTLNESLEPVSYSLPLESTVGLLASFVYARQYDPVHERFDVELSEPKVVVERDPTASFVEQLLMTLGEHSGHSITETNALFETKAGDPILATLRDEEYPDKSKTENSLYINEFVDKDNLTTSVETTLHQDIVNVDLPVSFLKTGRLERRYAEQSSMRFAPLSFPAKQYIDPERDHARWVSTCRTFLATINPRLEKYADLDGMDILD